MRIKYSLSAAAIVAAMAAPAAVWAGQQQPAYNMAGVAQPASQAAVAECAQAQPQALQTLDAANMRLEAARQSNSPAAMRAAVDDLQGALRQLRALLGACAGLQAASAADMPAGHVMPGGQQMPNIAQALPAAPGTAIMNPGSTALAPAAVAPAASAPAADPHGGHVMPGAPQSPASAPLGAPQQRPAAAAPPSPGRAAPAPAADPHGGHVMPAATARPVAPASRPSPAGPPAPSAPAATPTASTPATSIAELTCRTQVDGRTAPRVLHQGQTYYFCSEQDRAEFVKNPGKYVNAPASQPAPSHAH